MHVSRLRLKDIRGIEDLELDFGDDDASQACKLLIGKNGTGKSSVLRSVVLGLASETDSAALLAETFGSPFVSLNKERGSIEVDFVDSTGKPQTRTMLIDKGSGTAESIRLRNGRQLQDQPPLVVALGAGRSNEGASSVSAYGTVHSTYMLFNYEGTFIQPELTLRRLQDYLNEDGDRGRYEVILQRIKLALGARKRGRVGPRARRRGSCFRAIHGESHPAPLLGGRIQSYT